MEKKRSILDEEWRKKRLAKLSPCDRAEAERAILESERIAAKWRREEEALRRMPKEQRLKAICAKALDITVDMALGLGRVLESKGIKDSNVGAVKSCKHMAKFSLTSELKKYKVLPLEG